MSDRFFARRRGGRRQEVGTEDPLARPRARAVPSRREKRGPAAEIPERRAAEAARRRIDERQTAKAGPLQQQMLTAVRPRFPARTVWTLLLLLIIALLALAGTKTSLRRLRTQREDAAAEYQRLVARHTVAYREWIEKYALQNGIEPAFAAAVILRESSYDPMATSSVGARGLMQLMPDTFQQVRAQLKENTTFDDMYDPEQNIRYGCWYLGYLCRMFDGDPIEMACAYHAGPNNVKLWIMNYAADGEKLVLPEIPMEDTRYYAGKVYEAYSIYYQHFYPDPLQDGSASGRTDASARQSGCRS